MLSLKRVPLIFAIILLVLLIFSTAAMAEPSDMGIKYVYFERTIDSKIVMIDYETAVARAIASPSNTKLYNAAIDGIRKALLNDLGVWLELKSNGNVIDYNAVVEAGAVLADVIAAGSGAYYEDAPTPDLEQYLDEFGFVQERKPIPRELADWLTVTVYEDTVGKTWVITITADYAGVEAEYGASPTIGDAEIRWAGKWNRATFIGNKSVDEYRWRYLITFSDSATEPVIGSSEVRVMVNGWWNW